MEDRADVGLETDLEDVEICHVQCTVKAFMYHPADAADAMHEAAKHPSESQCGRPHVAWDLLYLT